MLTDIELEKALELHRKGFEKEALTIYRNIVQHDPCHADSWHLMGLIAFDENRFDEAEQLIRKAIALSPSCVLYRTNLGLVLSSKGDIEKALSEYMEAFSLSPECHDACYAIALILQNTDRKEQAFAYYEKALAIKPDHAETWNNLGNLAMDFVRPDEAVMFFTKAIGLAPDFSEAYNNLGCLFLKLNKPDEAMPYFNKALSLSPDFYEALTNLGNSYKKKGEWELAIDVYEKALTVQPRSVETKYNLADAFRSAGMTDKALDLFIETVQENNDHGHAFQQIVSILSARCDWDRCEPYQERLKELTEQSILLNKDCPESPFSCLGRYPDEQYARTVAATWSRKLEEFVGRLGIVFNVDERRAKDSPIVLGYLSNNVKNHPNAHLVLGLFRRHDRSRFRVNVYSYGENDESLYRKSIEADADVFRDIKDMSYVDAARTIHEDGVDILIDLTGYTLGSMMEIPALRPAPIQVRYLGFPGSMQASFFDYIITDSIMTPPEDQRYYTEKFVFMPRCYQINDNEQPVSSTVYTRSDFHLPENDVVFCSFNSAYKIEGVMFGVWMDILKAVPGSVLWLLKENDPMVKNLKNRAVKLGVDENRLVFSDKMAKNEHLSRLKLADLALDTRLVSGHITTSDALWAGVPVITKRGDHFISRAPSSILTHVGLGELVTETLDEYKDLAVKLAKDRHALERIKEKLKENRKTAPLFDTERFVKNYEKGLSAMWDVFRKGNKPEMIWVIEDKSDLNDKDRGRMIHTEKHR